MPSTAALVCCMTKSILGSRRVVALDSGFGGTHVAVELKKKGLYSTSKIKKKAHWPAGTKSQEVCDDLAGKEVRTI
eukprot:CAMPEP_0113316150 /NCGR_PEP_ID=MMETSP0010_2-20120614/11530_1 /TAXON_ID=216773 ORGANISM="Corethron hystrix, Strain 308" /NCGR_SAMPLE_ID=MMETSP0010_2 /ASSEMBLY_ACC=CAM_ASM_000155 /LENGTH=75 /DNA_ID=CAMNT_0000172787 /DNA_START=662 /DNA_END=889 /DNA_ORIENTATION=- /assembly_acc=CAM_ASM_000155